MPQTIFVPQPTPSLHDSRARAAMAADDDEWRSRTDREKIVNDLYVHAARMRREHSRGDRRIVRSSARKACARMINVDA